MITLQDYPHLITPEERYDQIENIRIEVDAS